MGIKLSELEEGSAVTLRIRTNDNTMQLGAVIKKHVRANLALITLSYATSQRLNFSNVMVDMEYCQENDVPIMWHDVKIMSYQSEYVLQVTGDGVKHNRRSYFRLGLSIPARLRMNRTAPNQITVKDISLSGFAISDRKKELHLAIGEELSVHFQDLGHELNLAGRVVRIEEREDMTVYGLTICNICKDLSSYISTKQRQRSRR